MVGTMEMGLIIFGEGKGELTIWVACLQTLPCMSTGLLRVREDVGFGLSADGKGDCFFYHGSHSEYDIFWSLRRRIAANKAAAVKTCSPAQSTWKAVG